MCHICIMAQTNRTTAKRLETSLHFIFQITGNDYLEGIMEGNPAFSLQTPLVFPILADCRQTENRVKPQNCLHFKTTCRWFKTIFQTITQTSPCWPTWAYACRWVCIRIQCCWSCFPTGSDPSCCSCSTSPATPFQTFPPLWTEAEADVPLCTYTGAHNDVEHMQCGRLEHAWVLSL